MNRPLVKRALRSKRAWGGMVGLALVGALSIYALASLFRSEAQGISFQQAVGRISFEMFLLSGLVYVVALAFAVLGWGWILGRLTGMWNWAEHARIYCVTAVTRRLPGTIWYVFGRIVLYEQYGVARSITTIASGIEYAAIVLGGVLIALLTWPLALSLQSVNPLWMVGGLVFGFGLLNPWSLRWIIRRVSRQQTVGEIRYRDLLAWIGVYGVVWITGGVVLFVLATMIHPLPWTLLPTAIGIWSSVGLVSSLLAFIPFGLIQEVTLAGMLAPLVGAPEALVIALLMRGVLTVNEVLWGLIAGAIGWLLPSKKR